MLYPIQCGNFYPRVLTVSGQSSSFMTPVIWRGLGIGSPFSSPCFDGVWAPGTYCYPRHLTGLGTDELNIYLFAVQRCYFGNPPYPNIYIYIYLYMFCTWQNELFICHRNVTKMIMKCVPEVMRKSLKFSTNVPEANFRGLAALVLVDPDLPTLPV